jgi:FMN-dependent NADH-azoreductase
MKLLQIDSSALGTQSATRELTQAIVQRWVDEVADIELVRRDLDRQPLPHLTGAVLGKTDPADAELGETVMREFLAADVIVIGAPMYNFSVPSTLKAWIDRIAVAGRTFRYTATGPEGLVHSKKVIVASARGSVYGDSHPADFQEAYLRQVFGFLGIEDVEFIRAEGLGLSPEQRSAGLRAAHATIAPPLALAA